MSNERIGRGDGPKAIYFATDAENPGTETPICPVCESDLRIHPKSESGFRLICDCEQTPAFEIHRVDTSTDSDDLDDSDAG